MDELIQSLRDAPKNIDFLKELADLQSKLGLHTQALRSHHEIFQLDPEYKPPIDDKKTPEYLELPDAADILRKLGHLDKFMYQILNQM